MINRIQLFGLAIVILFTACETDDVAGPNTGDGPEVTVSLSSLSILENGGSADIIASLSSSSSSDVSISFSLAGSAIQGCRLQSFCLTIVGASCKRNSLHHLVCY